MFIPITGVIIMKCDFCGNVFDIDESKGGCAGCPMNKTCKKIKCPNCNYEMYPKPGLKIPGFLKSLGRKSEGK